MNGAMRRAGQAGFTLVEAVMVIVIIGILGGIVAVFIRVPVQAYTDTAARAELSDAADTAVRRVGRDVRLALPNSVVVSDDTRTMSFLLTKTGGRYRAAEDVLPPGNALDFVNGALNFDVLGTMPDLQQAITPGDVIVVYNLGPGNAPADAYPAAGLGLGGNAAVVAAVAGNTITLRPPNPFAIANPVMSSPSSRFQVVTGTVNYVCNLGNGTLTRFWANQQLAAPGATPPPGVGALLAERVTACAFNYVQPANTRSALVEIRLTLRRPGGNEQAALFHQIHVDNTP